MNAVLGLDPARYQPHALHDSARMWPETNCYVDLWIELLAARGLEPAAMFGFTVGIDFEGDQATFFKPPTADLTALYGVDIQELSLFDRLEGQLVTQAARGRIAMVEVDAFHLPDTVGLTYGVSHSKTTIGIERIDPQARRLIYFHNAGLFSLDGADYDAILRPAPTGPGLPLFPYTELARFDRFKPASDLKATARALLARHLAQRPDNPFEAWAEAWPEIAADLATRPPEYFHTYAFGTPRQYGAAFELLASHLDWLDPALAAAADEARGLAEAMKVFQFKLARAMARQRFDGLADLIADAGRRRDALMRRVDDAFQPQTEAA
jgi:hypothetical protein